MSLRLHVRVPLCLRSHVVDRALQPMISDGHSGAVHQRRY